MTLVTTIIASILLAALTVAVISTDRMRSEDAADRLARYEEESRELIVERQKLTLEYGNVEKYMLDRKADGSYLGIVFTEIDKQLYESVYPMFINREKHLVGTICLEKNALPGGEGLISRAQYDVMCADGWDTALLWNGDGLLREYLAEMKTVLADMDIDFPDTVVFASGRYALEYDKLLMEYGIAHAIHHGENNLKIVDRSCEESGVWHPGMISWNTTGVSNDMLNNLIINGGVAMFEVNFSGGNEILFDSTNSYRTAAFGRMLTVIERAVHADELVVTELWRAKEGRAFYLKLKEESLEEIAARRAEILDEIAEIEKTINEIYYKHHGEGR